MLHVKNGFFFFEEKHKCPNKYKHWRIFFTESRIFLNVFPEGHPFFYLYLLLFFKLNYLSFFYDKTFVLKWLANLHLKFCYFCLSFFIHYMSWHSIPTFHYANLIKHSTFYHMPGYITIDMHAAVKYRIDMIYWLLCINRCYARCILINKFWAAQGFRNFML